MDKEHQEQFVDVAVVTTSGTYPESGFDKTPSHQKVSVQLSKAARELNLASTDGWVARAGGNEIDPTKSYLDNGISGEILIDWGPRQGGGGAVRE